MNGNIDPHALHHDHLIPSLATAQYLAPYTLTSGERYAFRMVAALATASSAQGVSARLLMLRTRTYSRAFGCGDIE